jgi:cell division protein FtsZ
MTSRETENQSMTLSLQLPKLTDLRPRLTVVGVGGAGCNAINNMIAAGLSGVDFIVANTDAQALAASSAEHRVQLGITLTEGLGAGSKPEVGEAAAEEALDDLRAQLSGSHMVFIAAGMGGGTGTGAAAVIARVARELGILTVGIVTKPFHFEGTRRMRIADIGVAELKKYVDTLIVIPNQNLFRVANERTTFAEAFVLADQVLYSGVACIVDLIIKEGLINLDFADVRTVMGGMGTAMMGTGEASGESRAILAAEEAIANPLLDDVSLHGARGLLLSISGGRDLTLYEVDEAASRVRQEVDPEANIIVGATFDESLGDRVRVSIVASGMMRQPDAATSPVPQQERLFSTPQPLQAAPLHAAPLPPSTMPPLVNRPDDQNRNYSQPQAAPQSPAHDSGEMQRRLSAAMQPPKQHANPLSAQNTPPAPNWGTTPASKSVQAQPTDHRDPWLAPGDVTIEETAPTHGSNALHARGVEPDRTLPSAFDQHHTGSVYGQQDGFTPEMPNEIRRSPRRMPDVDDFPVVAQREYRAKAKAETFETTVASKRPGLFERLAGMGRRADDSHATSSQQPHTVTNQRPLAPMSGRQHPASSGNGGDWSPHDAPRSDQQGIDYQASFSKVRK